MSVIINGSSGVTTPDVTSDSYTGPISVSSSAPDNSVAVDASGNVGIGTSSPFSKLTGVGNSAFYRSTGTSAGDPLGAQLYLGDSNFNNVSYHDSAPGIGAVFSAPDSVAGSLAFYTFSGAVNSRAERLRIDTSGNLLVGTTNKDPTYNRVNGTVITADGAIYSRSNNTWDRGISTSSGTQISFYTDNGARVFAGSITSNGSSTSYNTSSDYRLKNTIAPMTGALAKVQQLKPVTYKWNADGSDGEGFIAHELQAVIPDAVVGEKDAVDAEGNPVYQGIDTSFLVATLTAAIQELKAELDTVKAELAAMKGTA